jgi:hypothetical protein
VLLTAPTVVACAELGRRTMVSPEEYDAYRRFAVAHSVAQKLGSGYDYVSRYGRGAYLPEVRAFLAKTEPECVRMAWNDRRQLEAFLRHVPHGNQAERAATRLVELRIEEDYRARHDRAFDEKIAAMESRLAEADVGRRTLVSSLVSWVRRVAAIRSWGGRTSDLSSDMIYAYRLSEPAARCDDERCVKTVTVSYGVPEGKSQSPREAVYDVGLTLSNGGVSGAYITGPELFTRLGEAVRVSSVSTTDLVGRAEAIGQATQVLALAIEPLLPASRCAAEAVSPVVLRRKCDGVDLRVISALDLSEEDRVVIEPSPQ